MRFPHASSTPTATAMAALPALHFENHGFECDEIPLPPEGDILDEGIGSTAGCVAVNGKSRSCKSSFGYEVVSGCGAPELVFLE